MTSNVFTKTQKNNMVKTLKDYNQPSKQMMVCDGCFEAFDKEEKGTISIRMDDSSRRYNGSGRPIQHRSGLKLCHECFVRISTEMNKIKINL